MHPAWRAVAAPGLLVLAAGTVVVDPPRAAAVAVAVVVCHLHCDGRDPALATSDRSAASTMLDGRTVDLRVSDVDAMARVALTAAEPGDELWLDRSFDGGHTWGDGPRLGLTEVPAGAAGWQSLLYNVDDPQRHGVGAVRGCARVARTGNLTCTDWARTTVNAADRRAAAVTGLMMSYQPATGLFARTGWWNSANALTAVIEYARLTGSTSYRYAIENTWLRQRHAALGEFRNEYVDDTGWWGLAWIAAYDLTKDPRYLATARADAEFMHAYWDGHCGGGVWWKTTGIVKNAITNSLYIQLNAALAGRVPDAGPYRSRALAGWAWFQATGLVNDEYLVNDGVSSKTCRNAGNTHWTYNSGVLIAALVELSRLTGDGHALTVARRVAVAMTTSLRFNRFGVFREQCEPGCRSDPDKASFKGAAVRGLSALNRATNAAFDPWLRKQADLTYRANRNRLDMYSFHWDGPFDWSDVSAQHSVVDLFNASP